jgi:8-amino-7-oxononanoate synthase
MLDFTSALYLGLHHPSSSLRPWSKLTTGVPAALGETRGAHEVAQKVAALQGCERGTLGTSTLHLFWDLFGMLAAGPVRIFVDAGAYPIAHWGVERAAGRGVAVHQFPHHDTDTLRSLVQRSSSPLRPLVVADGFCPGCGRGAPLAGYLDCARVYGGMLIVDDTQALGIFGRSPSKNAPYGKGGGGMLAAREISGPDVLVISSMAKAYGVPVAVLAGSRSVVDDFESKSQTRVHSSPPSAALIRAAEGALEVNARIGDILRLRLARLVERFRNQSARLGFRFVGSRFPVQTLPPAPRDDIVKLHQRLLGLGVRTVPHWSHVGRTARLSFLITARHTPEGIDMAAAAMRNARASEAMLWPVGWPRALCELSFGPKAT